MLSVCFRSIGLQAPQNEGVEITQELLAGLSPYRTHHINRFGDYTLDLDREIREMNFSTKII